MKRSHSLCAIIILAALFLACAKDGPRETRTAAQAETAPSGPAQTAQAKALPGLYWQRLEENGAAYLSDKAGNKVPFG
ncbi:MAG: hypothetical protein LBS57_06685, partial [Treponema sp.]|nr:hypothetical protein [Treponema sp.]